MDERTMVLIARNRELLARAEAVRAQTRTAIAAAHYLVTWAMEAVITRHSVRRDLSPPSASR